MQDNNNAKARPKVGLILTGGGARAAYQVGVLRALSELLPKGAHTPFPIICGTSAGSINATLLAVDAANFGAYPMATGQSRLARRFYEEAQPLMNARARSGEPLDAAAAFSLGLVTTSPDDIDWADEVRIAIEERVAMSPDALTGLEANLRFNGTETMATRIFGRLSAWQNWIFQRPNAVGEKGALKVYGKGDKAAFDWNRV